MRWSGLAPRPRHVAVTAAMPGSCRGGTLAWCVQDRRSGRSGGYILLETVVATGLLIVGLAVIGSQVQEGQRSVRTMERKIRAIELARQKVAELEMGLLDVSSLDEQVQEGDFGPRYPNHGWLLSAEETTIDEMFLVRLDVLFRLREDEYTEDDFDFDEAEVLHTVYTMRAVPRSIDFAEDLGLNDDELTELSERFDELGIEGLDVRSLDPRLLQTIDFEKALEALPVILQALNMDVSQLAAALPPELLRQLRERGLLGEEGVSGFLEGLEDSAAPQEETPEGGGRGDRRSGGGRSGGGGP